MKPKCLIIPAIAFLVLVLGCSGAVSPFAVESLKIAETTKRDLSKYKAVIIVPASGCGGCISTMEGYLLNVHIPMRRKSILFIITGYVSRKQVIVRLGKMMLEHEDIFVDYKKVFGGPPYVEQYPSIFFITDGTIARKAELSQNSSGDIFEDISSLYTEGNGEFSKVN